MIDATGAARRPRRRESPDFPRSRPRLNSALYASGYVLDLGAVLRDRARGVVLGPRRSTPGCSAPTAPWHRSPARGRAPPWRHRRRPCGRRRPRRPPRHAPSWARRPRVFRKFAAAPSSRPASSSHLRQAVEDLRVLRVGLQEVLVPGDRLVDASLPRRACRRARSWRSRDRGAWRASRGSTRPPCANAFFLR